LLGLNWKSRAEIAEIADRPDKPPQRLEWLVEAIPEQNNQHKPLISGDPFKWLWR